MVTYKLATRLQDLEKPVRRSLSNVVVQLIAISLMVLGICSIAVFVGSPAPHQNCDHISNLAGRCHE